MKSAKVILTILFLLGLFIPSGFVHADIAPPPAPQLGGLEPLGYQATNVQMIDERVEMELQPLNQESRVKVIAYFTMHNLGSFPESMQVIFPLESFTNCMMAGELGNSYTLYRVIEDSFEVMLQGSNVPIQKVITNHPHQGCEQMTWAGFDVTFPVGENVVIQVDYVMEATMVDFMQNIEYVLETGAGWAGSIQRGYVTVKFPYAATIENVLPESTPGYQFLNNEVFWSFENLEPTSENNIRISIVSAHTWQEIVSLRGDITENPASPEKWLKLAQTYREISTLRRDNIRSDEYSQLLFTTYEYGIAANPDSAELYAKYAESKLHNLSPYLGRQLTEAEAGSVLSLLNKAFALEPNNATAQTTLSELMSIAPFVTFTPPPTVTPAATITPTPSETPIETDRPDKNRTGMSFIIFGVLIVLVVGIGIDTLRLIKRTRK